MAMMKAYSSMLDNASKGKGAGLEEILGKNLAMIAALKAKMSEVENDNEALANENEELR